MPGPALRSGMKKTGAHRARPVSGPDSATVADEETSLQGDLSPAVEESGTEGAVSSPEAGPSNQEDPGTRGTPSEGSRSASGSPARSPLERGPQGEGGGPKGPTTLRSSPRRARKREGKTSSRRMTSRGRATKRSKVPNRKRNGSGSSDSSSSASSSVQRTKVGPDPVESGGTAGAVVDTPAASHTSSQPKTRRRREVMPPQYDGKGVAFTDYLEEFDRVAEFNSWSKSERCFHLWTHISGPARQKIVALKYVKDWDKLVKLLKSKFCSTRALDAYRTKWVNAKRGPDMDLESYGLYLLDLSRKANPESSIVEQERFAKERFIETGGSTHMRFWLAALKPATLQDAIDLAVQYDAAYQAARPHKPDIGPLGPVAMPVGLAGGDTVAPKNVSEEVPSTSGQATGAEIAELLKKLHKFLDAAPQATRGTGPRKGARTSYNSRDFRCFGCQQPGHIKKDCPNLPRGGPRNGWKRGDRRDRGNRRTRSKSRAKSRPRDHDKGRRRSPNKSKRAESPKA